MNGYMFKFSIEIKEPCLFNFEEHWQVFKRECNRIGIGNASPFEFYEVAGKPGTWAIEVGMYVEDEAT